MGSHSVTCHPTEVTAPPSPQPGRCWGWYSIYRPRKDERPSWLVIYQNGLPVHRRSPIRVLDTLRGNSGAPQLSYICRISIPLYKILHDRYDRRVAPRHVSIAKPQFSLHWVGSIAVHDTFGTKGGRFRYMSISVQTRSRSVHGNYAYATSVYAVQFRHTVGTARVQFRYTPEKQQTKMQTTQRVS